MSVHSSGHSNQFLITAESDSFLHVEQNPKVQHYLAHLTSEPRHAELCQIAKERIHPPQQAGNWTGALGAVGGFAGRAVTWGVGAIAGAASNIGAAAVAVKTQGVAGAAMAGAAAGFQWARGQAATKVNEQEEIRLEQVYITHLNAIESVCRAVKSIEGEEETLDEVRELRGHLNKDTLWALGAIMRELKNKAASGTNRQDPVGVMLNEIDGHIKAGTFEEAINRTEALIRQLKEEGGAQPTLHLLKNARSLLIYLDNPVNQWVGSLLAHDMQQLISLSPILQLYQLRGEIETGADKAIWKETLNQIRTGIVPANSDDRTTAILSQIEELVGQNKAKEALKLLDAMSQALIPSLIATLESTLKEDRKVLGHAIVEEGLGRGSPELQERIRAGLANETAVGPQAAREALMDAIDEPDVLEPMEKRTFKELYAHLEQDFPKVLFQAISIAKNANTASPALNHVLQDVHRHLTTQMYVQRLGMIDDLLPEERAEADERLSPLVDLEESIKAELKNSRGIAMKAIAEIVKAPPAEMPALLGNALEKIMENESEGLVRKGKKAMVDGLRARLDAAEGKGAEGALEAQALRVVIGAAGEGNEGIGESLKGLFDIVMRDRAKPYMRSEIAKLRATAGESSLVLNLQDFDAKVAGQSQPLSGEIDLHEVRADLEGNNRRGALAKLRVIQDQIKYRMASSREEQTSKKLEDKLISDLIEIVERDDSALSLKVTDTLEKIIEGEGKNLQVELTQLLALVAKNEGREFILKHVQDLKEKAEYMAKGEAIHDIIMQTLEDLNPHREVLEQMQALVKEGKADEAKAMLMEAVKPIDEGTALYEICQVLSNPQATIHINLLETFEAVLTGKDPKTPIIKAFDAVKAQSDRVLFKKIADQLESGGPHGLQEFIRSITTTSDGEQNSVPHNLRRIITYLFSSQGRVAAANVGARHLMAFMMGKDEKDLPEGPLQIDQAELSAQLNKLLGPYLSATAEETANPPLKSDLPKVIGAFTKWLTEPGGGLEQVVDGRLLKPLLEKIDQKGLEGVFTEWLAVTDPTITRRDPTATQQALKELFLSSKGAVALAKVLGRNYAAGINGGQPPVSREAMIEKRDELSARLAANIPNGRMMTDAIVRKIVGQIELEIPQHIGSTQEVMDVGEFVLSSPASARPDAVKISFAKLGPVTIVMDRDDLNLAIEVAVTQMLLKGKDFANETAAGASGHDFVCDLAAEACRAMTAHVHDPKAETKFSDEKASHELVKLLIGKDGADLPFTPFVQQVIMELLAPEKVGSIPFRLMGLKPIGPQIVDNIFKGGLYKGVFDEILANKLKKKIEEVVSENDFYGYVFEAMRKGGKKTEMSKQEQAFSQALGSLGLAIFEKIDPHWAAEIDGWGQKENVSKAIGDFMVPVLRDFLRDELKVKDHQEISVDDMYNYALRLGADALNSKAPTDEKKASLQEKAIEALAPLALLAEPMRKHKSIAGMVFGGIVHFLAKITIDPLCWLMKQIVIANCKHTGKPYDQTLWYRATEGRRLAHARSAAKREYYEPLRDIIQSDMLWERVYQRVIHPKIQKGIKKSKE